MTPDDHVDDSAACSTAPPAEAAADETEASVIFGQGRTFLAKYAEQPRPLAKTGMPDPAHVQLNRKLVRAGTAARLLEIVQERFGGFNAVNVITALHHLAKLVPAHRRAGVRRDWRCKILVRRLGMLLRGAEALRPRDLSNAAWALMKLGFASQDLFLLLKRYILMSLEAFEPVNLSMMLSSFSHLGLLDEGLCEASVRQIRRQLSDFEPRQISSVIWDMAKAGFVYEDLFRAGADMAVGRLDAFDPLGVSKLLCAFAKAKLPHPELFREAAAYCTFPRLASAAAAQDAVTNFAKAYAEEPSEESDLNEQVFNVLAQVAGEDFGSFRPQQLVILAEAFSRAGLRKKSFVRSLGGALVARRDELWEEEVERAKVALKSLGFEAFQAATKPKLLSWSLLGSATFLIAFVCYWRLV